MPENEPDVAPPGRPDGNQTGPSGVVTAPREAPTFICEICGPEKPVAVVYPCTLCTMSFCVEHLALKHHYCIGALGKPQVT